MHGYDHFPTNKKQHDDRVQEAAWMWSVFWRFLSHGVLDVLFGAVMTCLMHVSCECRHLCEGIHSFILPVCWADFHIAAERLLPFAFCSAQLDLNVSCLIWWCSCLFMSLFSFILLGIDFACIQGNILGKRHGNYNWPWTHSWDPSARCWPLDSFESLGALPVTVTMMTWWEHSMVLSWIISQHSHLVLASVGIKDVFCRRVGRPWYLYVWLWLVNAFKFPHESGNHRNNLQQAMQSKKRRKNKIRTEGAYDLLCQKRKGKEMSMHQEAVFSQYCICFPQQQGYYIIWYRKWGCSVTELLYENQLEHCWTTGLSFRRANVIFSLKCKQEKIYSNDKW